MPRRGGFTLIELLIAIVIVGILASVALSTFWKAKDRGLQASVASDLRTMATHQETYFESAFQYAAATADLAAFTASPGVTIAITYAANDGWAATGTHASLPGITCGLLIGAAPAGSADPAVETGVVTCTT